MMNLRLQRYTQVPSTTWDLKTTGLRRGTRSWDRPTSMPFARFHVVRTVGRVFPWGWAERPFETGMVDIQVLRPPPTSNEGQKNPTNHGLHPRGRGVSAVQRSGRQRQDEPCWRPGWSQETGDEDHPVQRRQRAKTTGRAMEIGSEKPWRNTWLVPKWIQMVVFLSSVRFGFGRKHKT